MKRPFEIIDISQPVESTTACFPGDTPFSKSITLTYEQSKIVNLTAITLSPHVGTHADAPIHIQGSMDDEEGLAGSLPLSVFVGDAIVLNLYPLLSGPVTAAMLQRKEDELSSGPLQGRHWPERVLLRTQEHNDYRQFKKDYAYIGEDAAQFLSERGVKLCGIDTPSVDQVEAKELCSHKKLLELGFYWLENLDLTLAPEGKYFLVAAPIKLMEAEAAPVRAILLTL